MTSRWEAYLDQALESLRVTRLSRELRATVAGNHAAQAQTVGTGPGRTVRLFSLNDYLGLSTHPQVCAAAASAALAVGSGPRSSALVGGYTTHHRELESDLATLAGTEECLLFPSGFAANCSVMAAVAGSPEVEVFSDELNHASLVDGLRLAKAAGARVQVYRHNDMAHLESLLQASPAKPTSRRLVITDTLFSMDGDYAPLARLAELRRAHGFLLAVDEAHATLVCGDRGAGAAEAAGVEGSVDLHLGTLSKAVGCSGGFLACSRAWKALLVAKARGQVFSTAMPVPMAAAASAALRVAREEPELRRRLWRHVGVLSGALGVPSRSPILPVVVGAEARALRLADDLWRAGFHVPAIRPPTVPPGTSRLRISLSAAHSDADVVALVRALQGQGLAGASAAARL
uniref:Aminotransferase class I/classII large domain-containing protein n=2 Tax=Auxenochlorella protothecoides TaxID=3075 RepID=A0A1D2A4U9_AUXPR